MPSTDSMPSFKFPPVNEVFLGVQFDTLEAFNIATYGLIWEKFRDRFPSVEHHMPLEPQFERIGGRKSPIGQLPPFRIEQMAPLPRAWFLSRDGCELVQIQPDRFIRNWRRLNSSDEYPRYEKHIRPEFEKDLKALEDFFRDIGMGRINPNQCEVSYINHIDAESSHDKLNEVFIGWSNKYCPATIADIEDINLGMRHVVKDSNGEFLGRLYIKIQPAFRAADDKPIFLVELTLRGRPLRNNIEGVMEFMNIGREKIVRAFAEMTTPEMHKLWQREA